MKRAGWITTAAVATAAVIGGGATVYALTTDEPEPTETPAAIETVSPEPTESIEPTTEPSETPGPITVTPTPEESSAPSGDDFFVAWAQDHITSLGVTLSDDEIRAAADYACQQLSSGLMPSQITSLEGLGSAPNNAFASSAKEYYCD